MRFLAGVDGRANRPDILSQIPGFDAELDTSLWNALALVTSFPTHDLFSTFR